MKFEFAPLKGSFMIISIIGFVISAIWIYRASPSLGFSFALIFVLMFIASLISMTYGPVSDKDLHVDERVKRKRK